MAATSIHSVTDGTWVSHTRAHACMHARTHARTHTHLYTHAHIRFTMHWQTHISLYIPHTVPLCLPSPTEKWIPSGCTWSPPPYLAGTAGEHRTESRGWRCCKCYNIRASMLWLSHVTIHTWPHAPFSLSSYRHRAAHTHSNITSGMLQLHFYRCSILLVNE